MHLKVCHRSEKFIISSMTMAALGLLCLSNTTRVKAEELLPEHITNEKSDKENIDPTATITIANEIVSSENNHTQNNNENDENKLNVHEPTTSNQKPAENKVGKGNLGSVSTDVDSTWNGLNVNYNKATKTLTIPNNNERIIENPLKINGNITGVDTSTIEHIMITGKLKISGNASYLFANLTSLKDITGLENLDTTGVTNMLGMFTGDQSLTELNLSNFNTSQVTSMGDFDGGLDEGGMFQGCSSLTRLDLSSFDTKSLETLHNMFLGCANLETIIFSNKFKVQNVGDLSAVFYNDEKLSHLDLSNWDVSKVADMRGLFEGCKSLEELDLSKWQTNELSGMWSTFEDASNLKKISFGPGWDTSKVRTMDKLFRNCTKLTELDLSNFKTTDKLTRMKSMFENNSNLVSIKGLENFNTSKVNNMSYMFKGDHSLRQLNLKTFDMSSIEVTPFISEGTKDMLQGLNNLKVLILGEKTDIKDTNLDTPTEDKKWVNVGPGSTITEPKGTITGKDGWTSKELVEKYDQTKDADTYVKPGPRPVIPSSSANPASSTIPNVVEAVITVHYQDENGNMIADDVVLKGKVGENYASSQKIIPGYVFKEINGQAAGFFTTNPQIVTYIYEKAVKNPDENKQQTIKKDPTRDKSTKLRKNDKKQISKHTRSVKPIEQATTLPQTGGRKTDAPLLLAGALSLLLSIVGLLGYRRKND